MPSILLKSLFVGAVVAASAPALAETSPAPKTTLKYEAKSGKYCLTQPPVTGSRLPRILCQTAERWTADGLDMPKGQELAQK